MSTNITIQRPSTPYQKPGAPVALEDGWIYTVDAYPATRVCLRGSEVEGAVVVQVTPSATITSVCHRLHGRRSNLPGTRLSIVLASLTSRLLLEQPDNHYLRSRQERRL